MSEDLSNLSKTEILANAKSFEHTYTFGHGSKITLTTYPEGRQPNNLWYKLGFSVSETTVKQVDGKDTFHNKVRIGLFGIEFDEGIFESIFPGKFKTEPKF